MKARRQSKASLATRQAKASSRIRQCIRIVCVDDHALLVEGLRARFELDGRMAIVGYLETAANLVEEIERTMADMVLLDIDMPGPDVFEMVDRMHHQYPNLPFVFLSAHIRDGYLAAAYKCGASGYFAKSESVNDIIEAIEKIAGSRSGTFVLTPKVQAHCAPGASVHTRPCPPAALPKHESPVATPLQSLTSREFEILRLIGKGLTRVQIAEQIARSPKTVDGHQERIMKKLAVDSRTELLRIAIREGLAEA